MSQSETTDWVIVFEAQQRRLCQEQGLVLDAVDIPNLIADGPYHGVLLLVPGEFAARAREQLRLYAVENRRRPPSGPRAASQLAPYTVEANPAASQHIASRPVTGIVGYLLVMIFVFLLQGRLALGVDWLTAGGLDGVAVRQGEWWRLITALTLHGDVGHLVANLFFGALFGALASQYLGAGVGWATILLAAGVGNGLDLALLPPTHRAIGASTAVFAALGLVGALMWRAESRRHVQAPSQWARRFAPLIVAIMLLAYLGTGDARTDAVAHLTGFTAGLLAGAAFEALRPQWLVSRPVQQFAGLATLAVLVICWRLAVINWRTGLPM
ncbi:MAG: rhomboid family intramembrane serine protease [Gammaproteobacteria bacterium]